MNIPDLRNTLAWYSRSLVLAHEATLILRPVLLRVWLEVQSRSNLPSEAVLQPSSAVFQRFKDDFVRIGLTEPDFLRTTVEEWHLDKIPLFIAALLQCLAVSLNPKESNVGMALYNDGLGEADVVKAGQIKKERTRKAVIFTSWLMVLERCEASHLGGKSMGYDRRRLFGRYFPLLRQRGGKHVFIFRESRFSALRTAQGLWNAK